MRILMNAIKQNRVHQAYLFTGSRGIGKTSIARIFSKALRCSNTTEVDGWLRSCDACPSCKEITAGMGVDVLEIDGASNNGVDAIREIRENARFLPSSGSKKIYIIDEVHMLTTAAFNALLKTLEEPPAHVIFIFATTEPHKIPATILSRCQRLDYRRPTHAQIQGHLTQIAAAEGLQADPAALALIARAAEGSMRDSLSLLDQVIAYSGQNITAQAARESIGLIGASALMGLLRAVLGRKPVEALKTADELFSQGQDLRVLGRNLVEWLHLAILLRVGADPQGSDLSAEELTELREIAALRELEELELIFQVFHYGLESLARSPQPKALLDVLLVKCATAETMVPVAQMERVAEAPAPQATAPVTQPAPVIQAAPAAPVIEAAPAIQPAAAPIAQAPAVPAANLPRTWEGFIEQVRSKRPLLASILEHGTCLAEPTLADPTLSVGFLPQDTYYQQQLQTRTYADQLATIAREYYAFSVLKVQLQTREGGESMASRKEREQQEAVESARSAALNHPILKEAKALFGAELGPIEVRTDARAAH